MSSNVAPVRAASASSSSGMSGAIETPVTTPMRLPSRRGSSASPSRTRCAQRRDRADAVLDLREVAVVLGAGQRALGEQIQLVRAEHPAIAALGERALLPPLDGVEDARRRSRRPSACPLYRCENCVTPDRHERDADSTASPRSQRSVSDCLEHVAVVEARHDRPSGRGTECRPPPAA